ncbi:MFS transporter [Streptomyces sp. NBC_01306]|uniref:MFS transporter n=1 Tax=Streptomyces sp. NBC_01306 TaxID=2903819 RepID=UPI0022595B28|nr:MFS transporter [Streptomyces sp. NBC_01306]MCX4724186.1 MFS transporter [Streptomyces sp. NBC_01306]
MDLSNGVIPDPAPPDPAPPASAPPAHAPPPPHRRRNMALLAAASAADNTETSVVSVLFPAVQSALGLSLSALSWLVAGAKLTGVATGPLWVAVSRRTSRTFVLGVCTAGAGAFIAGVGASQNFAQLIVLHLAAAAGFAGVAPLAAALVGDMYGDNRRGRAMGYLYGSLALISAASAPLFGQLSHFGDGWRWGYTICGVLCVLVGLALLVFFRDPGIGASDLCATDLGAATPPPDREPERAIRWADVTRLLTIRSFVLILLQRLLSTQLLFVAFGVVFLVQVLGFSNAQASLAMLPYGAGYFLGTIVGGHITDRVHRRYPVRGRVAVFQLAHAAFAAVAFVATQFPWHSLVVVAALFAVLGGLQGVTPVVQTPMVMAVVPLELRALAFALKLSVMDAIGWVVFTLSAGYLGDRIGLRETFFWLLVVVMVANAAFISLFYRPYARDCARLSAPITAPA